MLRALTSPFDFSIDNLYHTGQSAVKRIIIAEMTGSQLKDYRQSLGATQEDLAGALGVNPKTVARWERDESDIPPYLELALKTVKLRRVPLGDYIRQVIAEQGMTMREVVGRAAQRGKKIPESALRAMIVGDTINPTISLLQGLAAGLGRPEPEVFEAAGVSTGTTARHIENSRFADLSEKYAELSRAQKTLVEPALAALEQTVNILLGSEKKLR